MTLQELLAIIIKQEQIHAKFLNTLSFLENTGARKISASEDPATVTTMILKHAAEEHRHAYYLKKQLEQQIATYHGATSALLFSSGYAANLGLFASLSLKESTLLMDERIHSSVIDGWRLGFGKRLKFRHNSLEDLNTKLKNTSGICYVAVESVYSMDGDFAPLQAVNALCKQYGASLIVDEAHAVGVFGQGLVHEYGLMEDVFATVIAYGKALGSHGAAVLGSTLLREYLINFARSFIYSTALPFSQLLRIQLAYQYLQQALHLPKLLQAKIRLFRKEMGLADTLEKERLSPIQPLIISGNEAVLLVSRSLADRGIAVYPILSPTVAKGTERLRLSLHTFNSDQEIKDLCGYLAAWPIGWA